MENTQIKRANMGCAQELPTMPTWPTQVTQQCYVTPTSWQRKPNAKRTPQRLVRQHLDAHNERYKWYNTQ